MRSETRCLRLNVYNHSPLYHFHSFTPKKLPPPPHYNPPSPLPPALLSFLLQSAGMEKKGPLTHVEGGKWCGVGGSRCSWSLIVWLVHSGFSSRVSSSQRGEEREKRFLTAHLHHVDWCVLVQNKASLIVTAVFQGGRETFQGSFRSFRPFTLMGRTPFRLCKTFEFTENVSPHLHQYCNVLIPWLKIWPILPTLSLRCAFPGDVSVPQQNVQY